MDNGPLSVSAPGKSLVGASAKDVTFSTRYPFHKLDSTNPVSFQIITIFMSKETPTPTFGSSNSTLVYFFPHGYKYVPSSWFLISLDNFNSVLGAEGVWVNGNATGTVPFSAQLNIIVDDTNVNFYIAKTWNTGDTPPSVLGFFFSIRSYIFVEDLLGNGVPSHA